MEFRFFLIIASLILIVWVWYDNNRLTVSQCCVKSPKITRPVKIVLLSDLHNKQFGKKNGILERIIWEQRPDLIAFTGDLEDRRQPYQKHSALFLTRLAEKKPVFFVYGNQEMMGDFKSRLTADLIEGGVTVLDGQISHVKINGQKLAVLGLNDYEPDNKKNLALDSRYKLLREFQRSGEFKLLLTHYPHFFAHYRKNYQYSDFGIDLVLAGHAHGGLIRLPFLNGVVAPGQGFFPRYTSGLYERNGVFMAVSRGLGNSGIPVRINNPPDVAVITLLPGRAIKIN